jgi:hypothetical protein
MCLGVQGMDASTRTCSYSEHGLGCKRALRQGDDQYCPWHKPPEHLRHSPEYMHSFNKLIEAQDGNWAGFTLPDNFTLARDPVYRGRKRFSAMTRKWAMSKAVLPTI